MHLLVDTPTSQFVRNAFCTKIIFFGKCLHVPIFMGIDHDAAESGYAIMNNKSLRTVWCRILHLFLSSRWTWCWKNFAYSISVIKTLSCLQ